MISAAARLVPAPIATQRGDSSSILLMGGSNSRLSGAPAVNILSAATTIDLPLSQIAAMQTVMGFTRSYHTGATRIRTRDQSDQSILSVRIRVHPWPKNHTSES